MYGLVFLLLIVLFPIAMQLIENSPYGVKLEQYFTSQIAQMTNDKNYFVYMFISSFFFSISSIISFVSTILNSKEVKAHQIKPNLPAVRAVVFITYCTTGILMLLNMLVYFLLYVFIVLFSITSAPMIIFLNVLVFAVWEALRIIFYRMKGAGNE